MKCKKRNKKYILNVKLNRFQIKYLLIYIKKQITITFAYVYYIALHTF